jgi:hypothetical protein
MPLIKLHLTTFCLRFYPTWNIGNMAVNIYTLMDFGFQRLRSDYCIVIWPAIG